MQLCDFDFNSISDLSQFIDTQPVDTIDLDIPSCLRAKLYYNYNHFEKVYRGLLVLGEQRGACDLQYYKQEMTLAFDRYCLKKNNWIEFNDRLYFELSEQNTILVDGSMTLIRLDSAFNRSSDNAKDIKAVTHYTSISAAYQILSTQSFLAKSLSKYSSEAAFSINENSRRLAFFVSLSRNARPSEDMWNRFGKKHRGCKIDFFFRKTLFDAFTPTRPLQAFDENKEEYHLATNHFANSDCISNVSLNPHYFIVEYSEKLQNNAVIKIWENGIKDYTIIDELGKCIDRKYQYQDEVRVLLYLWSGERTEIPFIQKVRIPFLPNAIDRVRVTIGKRGKTSADKVRALVGQYDWLEVVDE